MVTTCYSCKKEIGFFKPRGTAKDILKAGYRQPDGMTEYDRLCQECLDEIRRTQPQGSPIRQTRPMKMTAFIPLGLFAIWFLLKLATEPDGYSTLAIMTNFDPNMNALIGGGLVWAVLITGAIVIWDHYKSWRKKD